MVVSNLLLNDLDATIEILLWRKAALRQASDRAAARACVMSIAEQNFPALNDGCSASTCLAAAIAMRPLRNEITQSLNDADCNFALDQTKRWMPHIIEFFK